MAIVDSPVLQSSVPELHKLRELFVVVVIKTNIWLVLKFYTLTVTSFS